MTASLAAKDQIYYDPLLGASNFGGGGRARHRESRPPGAARHESPGSTALLWSFRVLSEWCLDCRDQALQFCVWARVFCASPMRPRGGGGPALVEQHSPLSTEAAYVCGHGGSKAPLLECLAPYLGMLSSKRVVSFGRKPYNHFSAENARRMSLCRVMLWRSRFIPMPVTSPVVEAIYCLLSTGKTGGSHVYDNANDNKELPKDTSVSTS